MMSRLKSGQAQQPWRITSTYSALLQIHKQSTIYKQSAPSHVSAQLSTSQKQRRSSHILWRSQSPQRYPSLHVHLLLRPIRQIFLIQLRPDRPRQQRIASYPMLAQRRGATLHQTQHTRFRRCVVTLLRPSDQRADAGNPDDAPAVGRLKRHLSRSGLDGEEGARQIRVLMPSPACGRDVEELLELADPRVRDEGVQSAELLHRFLYQLRARLRERDVAGHCQERDVVLARGVFDRVAGFDRGEGVGSQRGQKRLVGGVVAGEVVDCDGCAVGEEEDGDGASDAGEAAGDGEDVAGEKRWEGHVGG